MTYIKLPTRIKKAFDYRRPCDRCGGDSTGIVYFRSDLQREDVTNLLVCDLCLDKYPPNMDAKKRSAGLYSEHIYRID